MSEEVATEKETEEQKTEATGKTFTQEEVSAIAAKESSKAKASATAGLVTELGFSSPDELKSAVASFKEFQEKQKTEAQRLAELEASQTALTERTAKAEATINTLLEAELEAIPEDRRSLVPELDDPVARLAYISKNKAFLVGDGSTTKTDVGTSTAPGAPTEKPPITYDEYKKLGPTDLVDFQKQYPEFAKDYAERIRQGR